jgi:hypothetical protein
MMMRLSAGAAEAIARLAWLIAPTSRDDVERHSLARPATP